MAIQARTEFAAALNQLASEKGVDVTVVVEAIQQAALAAFRKDLSLRSMEIPENFDTFTAEIDSATGEISIMDGKKNITPPGFARIAAQTAKQVILQRLHEAEKDAISDEYEKKVGTIITGTIQRQEGNTYFVDLGRAEGIFPVFEQTRDEYYHQGQHMKFLIKEIREGRHGPEVVVSRSDASVVKELFALEVPEIKTGSVVIKDIAREAGSRTKISAISTQEGVDPVGSLVGQKGVRVQAVMNELGEERIDIISYSEDPAKYIASALSPAKDVTVKIEEKDGPTSPNPLRRESSEAGASRSGGKLAKVKIPTSQLSLAIGKGGQNVRLAAKLTGWKIDIEGLEDIREQKVIEDKEKVEKETEKTVEPDTEEKAENREEVVETVEDEIDKATDQEAGAIEPESTLEEAAPAAAQAETDMESDDKSKVDNG